MKRFGLEAQLEDLKQQGLYRSRRIIDSPQGVRINIDGREVLNFCSNDYLGLANHPQVIKAFQQAANKYGVGSGSAHLICGHSTAHHALEEELAAFTGRERVLLFSTGYMANIGVISALLGRGDVVYQDKLNHASLLDGGLLSGATFKRYLHADVDNLEKKFKPSLLSSKSMIVTDGIFSMDGDVAPLVELVAIAKQQQAVLMVDDAHGLGVLGKTGAGVVEQFALSQNDVPILVGTLGKAFGTAGAFVAGSELLIETLIQKARPYIYTTAMPAAVAATTSASLKLIINESWRREKLQSLSTQFRQGAEQLGLTLMDSNSAIQPILIGETQKAVAISQRLLEQGFLVTAIRPPTIPKGKARLRVTFSANHQTKDVDALLNALEQLF
ncbi:MAG: 8-amino-7-oxononanoate synthase [Methylococcaceae bacterium]|nr:8-amino-7-oxononanoate synthase [Methylococcaceae bacterium]